MAQRCSTNETKNAHQHPKSNQMRKLFRFIQVTNCLFLYSSHHYKFVFGDFVRRPFKHTYAKQATTANAFARFCIELQCFCCGRPPSPKSKRSTIIAGNIVRSTNVCVCNTLYPEIPIAPSNHSCGCSLPFFSRPLYDCTVAPERSNE